MNDIINIIIRTHNREKEFDVCYKSIKEQSYPNYALHIGSDSNLPCYYPNAVKLTTDNNAPSHIPAGHYFAPWNLHLETLAKHVVPGYVMYLDDDDKFSGPKSLQRIASNVSEDALLVWKVQIVPGWIVPSKSFGYQITPGDFSGIGMCFHTKHLPVTWGNISYGDFRVASQLIKRGLKIRWLDMVLTQTQAGPRNGK